MTDAATARPLIIGGRLLGWLHEPGGGRANGRGVVLCGALGMEGMRTYRSWRILADTLADEGFTALRFDYEGTGDSLDAPGGTGEGAVAGWSRSIVAAVEAMHGRPGIGRVSVVGLRLGALLAAQAVAGMKGVGDLALLAPGASGRHHARELRLLAEAWETALAPAGHRPAEPEGMLNVAGDPWSPAMLADIGRLDPRRLPGPPPPRVLILEPEGRGNAPALAAAFADAGAEATTGPFPGFEAFARDSILPQPPEEAFARVVRWLLEAPCPATAKGVPSDPARPAQEALILPEGWEVPARFGPGGGLFGILAEPAGISPGTPAVLLLNLGVTPRSGNGRLGTRLCRRLLRAGITSLRIDLAGLGDSRDLPGRRPSPLYDLAAEADVRAALDWLEACGHTRVVVAGICSGAYLAFHAARSGPSGADPRIVGAVSVNMQQFIWQEGMMVDFVDRTTRHPMKVYLRKSLSPRHLLRLVRGQVGASATLLAVARRALRRQRRWVSETAEDVLGLRTEAGQVRRWIREMSGRGVRVGLWYGTEDSGLPALAVHCGPNGSRLRGLPGVDVAVLEGVDHTLSFEAGRRRFMDRLERFVLSLAFHDEEDEGPWGIQIRSGDRPGEAA